MSVIPRAVLAADPESEAPDDEAGRHPFWRSVAFRLQGSMAVLLVLSLAVVGVVFSVFRTLEHTVTEMAVSRMPVVIAANRLGQESESIAAQAPFLALAESPAQIESLAARISDHLAWLDQLFDELATAEVDPVLLATMTRRRNELGDALNILQGAVKARFDAEAQGRETLDVLVAVQRDLRLADGLPAWKMALSEVVSIGTAVLASEGRGQIDRLTRDLAEAVAYADDIERAYPPSSEAAKEIWPRLRSMVHGPSDAATDRQSRFKAALQVKGALEASRLASTRLVGASADIITAIERRIRLNHDLVQARLMTGRLWVAGAAVLIALTVVGVLLYVRGSISRRLMLIHRAVMGRKHGRDGAVPAVGNDEIGEIGGAISDYLALIENREIALRSFKDQLEAILTAAPFPMAVLNADLVPLYLNPQAREILPALLSDGHFEALRGDVREGGVREACIQAGEAVPFWGHLIWTPVQFGAENAILLSVHDIDALKAAEARAADLINELTRSNADLEAFAYVTSHDLREPLRTVKSFLDLLRRRYEPVLQGDGVEFIGYAVDGVQRMDRLILDLLEYSRVGRQGSDTEAVNTATVIEEVSRSLTAAIEDTRAVIEVASPMPMVLGNRADIIRVFQNLLSNSLRYCWPDEAPVIRITAIAEGKKWRFFVRDNGIGINPQYHEKIFQVFQRLGDTSSGGDGGTGIGLAVCRRVVERLGGEITVSSSEGQGCEFSFTLPARLDAGQD